MLQPLHQYLNIKKALLLICFSCLYCLPYSVWAAEDEADAEEAVADETASAEGTETQSTNTSPKTAKYHLPNIPQKRTQSLIHHMELLERQDEIVQLTSSTENYYGLYLADMTGNPQGGVLILHDNQQHGHWPDIVAPLREYLPQHGWTTLTIELPDTPARKRIPRQAALVNKTTSTDTENDDETPTEDTAAEIEPIATNQVGEDALSEDPLDNQGPELSAQTAKLEDENAAQNKNALEPALPKLAKLPDLENNSQMPAIAEEEETIDPIEQYRKRNQQRIHSAMEYLRSKGQLNLVIIGYGLGAAWAIDYLHQQDKTTAETDNNNQADNKDDGKGLTLVTIDAMPSRHSLVAMNQQLTNIHLPFLDLIQPNKRYELRQGKIRQAIMNRNKNENYQQIITTDMTSYREDESPTNRRIRGWLKTHAGGALVKMNR